MWIFWIILGLGVVVGVAFMWFNDGYLGEMTFSGIMGGIIGAIAGSIVSMLVFYSTLGEPELREDQDLVALNLGSTNSGSFFLGSGTIKDETVYYYAYTREDGGVIVDHVNADDVVLYETDDVEPHMEHWVQESSWVSGYDTFEYRIYIPEDSIVTNYVVDLGDA